MSVPSKLDQVVFLTKECRGRDALTPELHIQFGENGFLQIVERTGAMITRLYAPAEVTHLDGDRWVLLSEGQEPLVVEKMHGRWNVEKAVKAAVKVQLP